MGLFLLVLVSYQNFNIPSNEVKNTSFSLRPLQNPINNSVDNHRTCLLHMYFPFYLFQSISHPTNSVFTNSILTPKYCFFVIPIINVEPLIHFPKQGPQVRHSVTSNLYLYVA